MTDTLSLIFGSAIEVEPDYPDGPYYRLYRASGRTFMGHDTWDIAHVCDEQCLASLMERDFGVGTSEPEMVRCDNGSQPKYDDSYVSLTPGTYTDGRPTDKFATVDVVDFSPGDDPFILCAVCERELLRDDEKFEAEYGHSIGARP